VIRPSIYAGEAQFTSLRELVVGRAEQQPGLEVFHFLAGDALDAGVASDAGAKDADNRFHAEGESGDVGRLTCRDLEIRARRIACRLESTTAPGDRVLLLVAPGLDFIAAFFGCVASGRVAVPVYPPAGLRQQRSHDRLAGILRSAAVGAVVAGRAYLPLRASLVDRGALARLPALLNVDEPLDRFDSGSWPCVEVTADSPAMLQYTSGSTAEPRGVVLTHGNLLHNSEHIRRRFEHTSASRGVIWLPPYHDMGLIGGIVQPLYAGFPVTLMSPMDFIQQPLRWLSAISRHRGTTSGGPNFAYDLCVERTTPEERAELDLSSWNVAFVGAEPIRAETLRRFAEAFEPAGFDPSAFYPCYGLAESTLIVSGPVRGSGFTAVRADETAAVSKNSANREHVGCGRPLEDQDTLVVDPETRRPCRENETGEVWVRGSSVAAGYWNDPEATAATFQAALEGETQGKFLRTGDLGYVRNSELFITGRIKDLIILAGVNYYPQDLEQTALAAHAALERGRAAAFSVDGPDGERLVLVAEVGRSVERGDGAVPAEIVGAVREAVAREHRVRLDDVCLVRSASVPTTLSGKVRRQLCRTQYLAGGLKKIELAQEPQTALRTPANNPPGARAPADKLQASPKTSVDPNSAARRVARRLAYVMVLLPVAGLVGAVWLGWGHGIGVMELSLLAGMYLATVLGVEVGLHRHYSHRAFRAHWTVRGALGILGSMAAQGPVLFWVSIHRRHHAHSDRPGDPHSPYYDGAGQPLGRSLWHAHVGWLFSTDGADLAAYAPDVLRDRLAFALHRMYPVWVAAGLALPAAIGGAITGTWMGALSGFLWGGLVRVFLVHHATWSVNSLCHVVGGREHTTHDHSTNNMWLILPSLGGSWHNNHHAYPTAAINTTRWWQADPSGWAISLLGRLGLAWDIRRITTGSARRDPSNFSTANFSTANFSTANFSTANFNTAKGDSAQELFGAARPSSTQAFTATVAMSPATSETREAEPKKPSSTSDAVAAPKSDDQPVV